MPTSITGGSLNVTNVTSSNVTTTGTVTHSGNLDFNATWLDAPSGTIITSAYGHLSTDFSTTNDQDQDTGLFAQFTRKLPGGTTAGTSYCIATITGGAQDANGTGVQGVSAIYRSADGGSASILAYVDAFFGGSPAYRPHSGNATDTGAFAAGTVMKFMAYARSRGSSGSHSYSFHDQVGGVSNHVIMTAYEIVN